MEQIKTGVTVGNGAAINVELGWIRHVMRSASMERERGREPDRAWLKWVIAQWVGEERGSGQLGYYARKEQQNLLNHRRTSFLGNACLWTGVAIAALLALHGSQLNDTLGNVLLVLMGVLPLVAGVRDAYSHKRAERELINQYRFMRRVFANAYKLLANSADAGFQRRVLKALGEAALEEGAEWILVHRERPLEHGKF